MRIFSRRIKMKRSYPLFIIDTSRAHGRARETDFVSCTSNETPFVAEITLLNTQELAIDQDWLGKSELCVYSDENPAGIRAKLQVVQGTPTKTLMRRAMKEWLARRMATTVDLDNISNEAVIKFCDTLLEQTRENLRENPSDHQAYMVGCILTKIKKDYEGNYKK